MTVLPEIRVRPEATRKRVVVDIRVKAAGAGRPAGAITVSVGRRTMEAQVVAGKARLVFRDLRPGAKPVVVRYAGTDLVRAGSLTLDRGRAAARVTSRRSTAVRQSARRAATKERGRARSVTLGARSSAGPYDRCTTKAPDSVRGLRRAGGRYWVSSLSPGWWRNWTQAVITPLTCR